MLRINQSIIGIFMLVFITACGRTPAPVFISGPITIPTAAIIAQCGTITWTLQVMNGAEDVTNQYTANKSERDSTQMPLSEASIPMSKPSSYFVLINYVDSQSPMVRDWPVTSVINHYTCAKSDATLSVEIPSKSGFIRGVKLDSNGQGGMSYSFFP